MRVLTVLRPSGRIRWELLGFLVRPALVEATHRRSMLFGHAEEEGFYERTKGKHFTGEEKTFLPFFFLPQQH